MAQSKSCNTAKFRKGQKWCLLAKGNIWLWTVKGQISVPEMQHKTGVISETFVGPNQGYTAQKQSLEQEAGSIYPHLNTFFHQVFPSNSFTWYFPLE